MAKNANFVSHKKSKLKENGGPKLPLAADLVEGEIAINFGKDVETLSIKNESGDVVTFSSDNYYTEKKLGSGFTGENSGVTVTEALENIEITVDQVIDETTSASTHAVATKAVVDKLIEDEQVWALALNELNNKKFGYAEFDSTDNTIKFYKSEEDKESGGTAIDSVDLSDISIDTDQDFSNTASTNPISTKAVYSAITDNELVWTNAFVALSGTVSAHTANTEIHVTAADKARWDSLWESGTGENAIVQKGGGNTASGKLSVAMGSGTTASGNYSIAEGRNTIASSYGSHAEGRYTTASASYSHSEGYGSTASGLYSHAEGSGTTASGFSSHAEGYQTSATSQYSHAEGYRATASGYSSHAEGGGTKANGNQSHAEGFSTKANGLYSHAEGDSTTASGQSSHAEGYLTYADGSNSHAEGYYTKANGLYSHAEGYGTTASGQSSHAEGRSTHANGDYSHAEGYYTTANNESEHASGQYNVSNSALTYTFGDSGNTLFSVGNGTADNARHNAFEIRQNGDIYITSGGTTSSPMIKLQDLVGSGFTSSSITDVIVENEEIVSAALNDLNDLVGSGFTSSSITDVIIENEEIVSAALNDLDERKLDASAYTPSAAGLWESGTGLNSAVLKGSSGAASGDYSVAEGYQSSGTGQYSHAEGYSTTAIGWNSHAEGDSTTASGDYSHAEGSSTTASGDYSHAEGGSTTASGSYSHAEGSSTIASGMESHAEGNSTVASGVFSHTEGESTIASGNMSHAEGRKTRANNKSEHASGQYNVSSSASTTFGNSGNTLFSVGNGTADNARHNAFEIRQNGDIYITSGNSDIRLQDYIGRVETVTAITPSNSGSTDPIATKVVAENELIVSNALNDLEHRKADKAEDLDGIKLKKITQSDYDALTTKDSNTLYIITD